MCCENQMNITTLHFGFVLLLRLFKATLTIHLSRRDAAHRVHPMAGQGANLGFGDVATLTDVIVQAVANGADIGSTVYLDEYQSSRLQHNIPVMASIHGLHFLYNTTWTPFVLLRSVGFNLLDALPSIKQLISRRANI